MTAGALTRPGERSAADRAAARDRLDLLRRHLRHPPRPAGAMLYSVAGGQWQPWAAEHLIRFGLWFLVMIALAMVDLQIWFLIAYPLYAVSPGPAGDGGRARSLGAGRATMDQPRARSTSSSPRS